MSDQDLEKEILTIVENGDLEALSVKKVQAQLEDKFGRDVVSGKKALVKAKVVEAVQKVSSQREAKASEVKKDAEAEKVKEEEKKDGEEQEEKESPKKATKKRAKATKVSTREKKVAKVEEEEKGKGVDDIPTNVEANMDPSDFVRRNPARSGRKVTKPPPKKKEKKPRDPNKPKRVSAWSKPLVLSNEVIRLLSCVFLCVVCSPHLVQRDTCVFVFVLTSFLACRVHGRRQLSASRGEQEDSCVRQGAQTSRPKGRKKDLV